MSVETTPAARVSGLRSARRWRAPALALLGVAAALAAVAAGVGAAVIPWAARGLAAHWLGALAVAALYTLPGLALLRLLWPRGVPLSLAARLALAAPVGVALPPLLLLAFETVGLPWGRAATWIYLLVSLGLTVGPWMRDRAGPSDHQRWSTAAPQRPALPPSPPVGEGAGGEGVKVALLALTAAALLARLYVVRDLPAGLLGDSYQHTLMAQLLVDNRGLFRSWEPYAPLTTFTYHFGFHANAAFVHWLTGAPVTLSTLWAGQVLNALAVPAAFALTVVALRGSPWAGVWAALVTGFVLTIPAHYVVWGRYTQLAGQLVLVAAVACWAALAEMTTDDTVVGGRWSVVGRLVALTALMTAAMMLTHYLVTVFAALFAGSYLLGLALARASGRLVWRLAAAGALAGGLALLLAAPWLANLLSGYLVRNATGFTSGTVDAARVAAYSSLPLSTPLYAKGYVLLAALGGLLAALWRREWRMALPAAWAALLVLAVSPQVLGLPGAGAIDNLTGLSALYLPLAPLAGYALATAGHMAGGLLQRRFSSATAGTQSTEEASGRLFPVSSVSSVAALVALLAVAAWGASWQARLIDGSTQLVTHADVAAMAWLREHTPPDAKILVNAFPAYGGTLVAGTDAGWWIPLLAGRQTTLPPLTYGSERGPYGRYSREVDELYRDLRGRTLADGRPIQVDITTPEALARLRSAGVTHVYSGASASPRPESADRIDTAKLRDSPAFRLVYERDGVEVFELVERVAATPHR